MKILIIHDRDDVAHEIAMVMGETFSDSATCRIASDSVTARSFLSDEIFDLCIIDLTLPITANKSRPDYQVAQNLLQELFEHDTMYVPGDIIGITRDHSALAGIEGALGKHLMTMIEEDSSGSWKERLSEKARYAYRGAYTRQISSTQLYDLDVIIVTALDEELRPFRELLGLTELPHYPGAHSFAFLDAEGEMRNGVAYSVGRAGPPWAASRAQSLVSMFRPRLMAMSGFCGGASKARLGDMIAFETAFDWDYGRWERDDEEGLVFRSRPVPLTIVGSPAHHAVREMIDGQYISGEAIEGVLLASGVEWPTPPRFYLAAAGSGGAVVADNEIVGRIRELSDAIKAIDMESYGVYNAAQYTHVVKPDVICIKTVADLCNIEKDDKFHDIASAMSATAIFDLITKFYKF